MTLEVELTLRLAGAASLSIAKSHGRNPTSNNHDAVVHDAAAGAESDASQEQTDAESFAPLEPTVDGFRNYLGKGHRQNSCWWTRQTC
ncbi:MAG TPA: hypothetical protein VFC19_31505 [Candidatus Limnocylindrales bacterium]|nr:hypothetical protein [Candidatus Limnocylindrales bacterium]